MQDEIALADDADAHARREGRAQRLHRHRVPAERAPRVARASRLLHVGARCRARCARRRASTATSTRRASPPFVARRQRHASTRRSRPCTSSAIRGQPTRRDLVLGHAVRPAVRPAAQRRAGVRDGLPFVFANGIEGTRPRRRGVGLVAAARRGGASSAGSRRCASRSHVQVRQRRLSAAGRARQRSERVVVGALVLRHRRRGTRSTSRCATSNARTRRRPVPAYTAVDLRYAWRPTPHARAVGHRPEPVRPAPRRMGRTRRRDRAQRVPQGDLDAVIAEPRGLRRILPVASRWRWLLAGACVLGLALLAAHGVRPAARAGDRARRQGRVPLQVPRATSNGRQARSRDPTSRSSIGVLGADDLAGGARATRCAVARSASRPVEVRRVRPGDPLTGLHVLFVGAARARAHRADHAQRAGARRCSSSANRTTRSTSAARSTSSSQDGRVRFEVALAAAERAGIKLSLAAPRGRAERAHGGSLMLRRARSVRQKVMLVVLATTVDRARW